MARENCVTVIGTVSRPTISIIEEFGTFKLAFTLTTLRSNGRRDNPRVLIYGLDESHARSLWKDLKENAIAIVRGMVTTRLNEKSFQCPKCGTYKKVNLLSTEIISYTDPVIIKGENDITRFSDISNEVSILGHVCSEVQHPVANRTMYQLAVSRKQTIAEQPNVEIDFPWVKSFGELADMDAQRLKKGSIIYLNGSIQTRNIERNMNCTNEKCDGVLVSKETVAEIITRNIEYLYKCNC